MPSVGELEAYLEECLTTAKPHKELRAKLGNPEPCRCQPCREVAA